MSGAQVEEEHGVVTGWLLEYRHIQNMGSGGPLQYGHTGHATAHYRPLAFTLTGLESYEYYEICVKAISGDLPSPCSAPMKIQSGESGM